MSFCSFSKENLTSGKTVVDNLFITNYLSDLSPEAVKVYLYGLYLCQSSDDTYNLEYCANYLGYTESDLKNYFKYLEEYGLLRVLSQDPFTVSYVPLNDLSAKYRRFKPEKYADFSKAAQLIITDRMISTTEYGEYFNLLESSSLRQESLIMIMKYCADLKGADISYKYILAVARSFISKNIFTPEQVEKELSGYYTLTKELSEVLRSMKITRNADVEDIQLYKKWTDEYNFEQNFILSIIKIAKIKNIKNLDKAIEELYAAKCFTEAEAKDFYETKQKRKDLSVKICKALGLYIEDQDAVIFNYLSPWLSYGYDSETLLFIANHSFRHNKRTLEQMNETVNKLMKLGLITMSSIVQYEKDYKETNEFISGILSVLGINRRPTDWDRSNLKIWRNEWQFSDELIKEAAVRAAGASNPIPYMNAVLSNWKSKNAYSIDEINAIPARVESKQKTPKTATHFDYERKYTQEELNSFISDLDDIDLNKI